MRFDGVGKSHLILRLVQILICLFLVMVFFNLGQYIQIPVIYKAVAEKDPGKPVLILSLEKPQFSIGEPIRYRDVILNDGNTNITFPVLMGDSELGFAPFFMTRVILTNEKGENLPYDLPPGFVDFLQPGVGFVTVKPHEAVPCYAGSGDLLRYVFTESRPLMLGNYSNALKNPGVYYLQTIFIYPRVSDRVRILQGNGVSYLSPPVQNVWKGELHSNKVKFEIKP
jgi:hypothetical protein